MEAPGFKGFPFYVIQHICRPNVIVKVVEEEDLGISMFPVSAILENPPLEFLVLSNTFFKWKIAEQFWY